MRSASGNLVPETGDTAGPATPGFATVLKSARVRARLTQEGLAGRAGISVRSVRDIERGRVRHPRPETVRLLGVALGRAGEELEAFVGRARDVYWTGRGQAAGTGHDGAIRTQPSGATNDAATDGEPSGEGSAWWRPPAQLPADIPSFTARERELGQLDGLLARSGGAPSTAVVITAIAGTAGIGKTALAMRWAHRVAPRFPDGQLYVNLRGFDPGGAAMSPGEAVRGFLAAFAVPPQRVPTTVESQTALYRSLLAGRRVLVVLDNARDAEQVRPLLPGAPGCLALVTSRNQLRGLVAAEGAHTLTLDLLTVAEARELLAGRLGAHRVAAEPYAVDQIVDRCARLPLALAIVAARAAAHPEFPLIALAGELHDPDRGLDAFDSGDAATNARAVFSWSYRGLDAPAARLFRLLGLHPFPDITARPAASLIGAPLRQAHLLLTQLIHAHLITEHVPGRYTFHDLLRAYATELAQEVDSDSERREATHRIIDYYVHAAIDLDTQRPTSQPMPARWL